MDRPIVFLDIDGVLNSSEDYNLLNTGQVSSLKFFKRVDFICKYKLKRLQKFLDEIDARVVMVSSWFWGDPKIEKHVLENLDMIDFLGLTSRTFLVSKHTSGGLGRGREVQRIVETLDLKNWIVIDDAGDKMYPFDTHQINGAIGLTDEDVLILKQRIKDGKH